MQVKDYLQALSNEGKIHVEKIGSGNWYWSFLSEEKKSREDTMAALIAEKEKVEQSVAELEAKLREASENRGDDAEKGEVVERHVELEGEVGELRKELEGYKDGDPGEVERKRKEIQGFKESAEKWTDNIGILEGYLKGVLGLGKEALDEIRRMVYGDEYVEGEGLGGL